MRLKPDFGFIRDDGGQEYFFHKSFCEGDAFAGLIEGTRVTFAAMTTAKGPRALNVVVVG